VHQDCLLQWLKYSKKDVCELCNHKFSFRPLYRPDMPERLPLWDLLRGYSFLPYYGYEDEWMRLTDWIRWDYVFLKTPKTKFNPECFLGVFLIFARFMRLTLTYTLVASCWLGLVPLMAARTHRLVFSGLLSSVFSSRILQLFSPENVAVDIFRGSMVVTLFLATFISLVWLREQIMVNNFYALKYRYIF
jgi:E3 ubiquitin-protein ligase MARCH6